MLTSAADCQRRARAAAAAERMRNAEAATTVTTMKRAELVNESALPTSIGISLTMWN
jgi:hypothetical protein